MKKVILLFLTLSVGNVYCQKINFGVKAGVNLTGFHTDNGTNTDRIGFNIGGIAKMEFNRTIGLQGELDLNTKGGNYYVPLALQTPEIKLTYINIPILAKIHITRKFNFELGPDFGFLISKKAVIDGETFNIDDMPSFDMNVDAGLSYEFEKGIFIQTRYAYGLTKLFDEREDRNSCISLSVGYFFK